MFTFLQASPDDGLSAEQHTIPPQAIHKFAVVIPVYNHESRLRAVVESALRLRLPVYVIDDGSTDATPGILKSIPGITVISHSTNLGKGAALMTGFMEAARTADFAITIDADGQHDPADAVHLMAPLQSGIHAIVIGRRENMLNDTRIKWTSRFGRKFSNFWVRMSGGPVLSDTQSGFRIYPIHEILGIKSVSRRFQFEVEIVVLAHWKGIPIVEVPVKVLYPSKQDHISHFRPFVDFWRNAGTFAMLIAMRILLPLKLRRRLIQK